MSTGKAMIPIMSWVSKLFSLMAATAQAGRVSNLEFKSLQVPCPEPFHKPMIQRPIGSISYCGWAKILHQLGWMKLSVNTGKKHLLTGAGCCPCTV